MSSNTVEYGIGQTSYRAAGELPGLTRLVDSFYGFMETLPEAKIILSMHPSDLTASRKKLTYFLSGWLGGPKLYSEHFGSIIIPSAHRHLPIGTAERDAWILCMQKAAEQQPYKESFKVYLIEQLKVPAERIRAVCSA
ncbi:group II truncated hemoglobin [Teredinibacter haidensis]|uniref:group II truncated hemoglobin n=1 Tax=Teredinibacter haidensis TaxID=2731755 RepID=UPI00163C4D02|nr:group II truncated hemoglobin [Teredinibacter haidensis]